ncbi:MAG: WhiB family transcriptional regulator [Betaproteobacteria bacterium]|nr:WhiB family transcriptional regulator [Betaproteobacteria bacterium]
MTADWRTLAACRAHDPALFFPERGQHDRVVKAKAICSTCLVKEPCLAYALDNSEQHGIWGETSERQRRKMRSERKRIPLSVVPQLCRLPYITKLGDTPRPMPTRDGYVECSLETVGEA